MWGIVGVSVIYYQTLSVDQISGLRLTWWGLLWGGLETHSLVSIELGPETNGCPICFLVFVLSVQSQLPTLSSCFRCQGDHTPCLEKDVDQFR